MQILLVLDCTHTAVLRLWSDACASSLHKLTQVFQMRCERCFVVLRLVGACTCF
jgi:hypothetical protein